MDDGCAETVGCGGRRRFLAAAAGIAAQAIAYGQIAIVANFACEQPHQGTAFQWFRHDGVLAMLPLPGNRTSMVWSIDHNLARI
jgi:2-polyprenyl-6-methoxyphenol hydroxylase-like FAD-dependent oxidoreductase